jgi:hypothetical protein
MTLHRIRRSLATLNQLLDELPKLIVTAWGVLHLCKLLFSH